METNRFTPAEITECDECFSIPLYQRLFEWEEPQIIGLLNDLKKSKDKKRPYYIGMLTATEGKDLVDGQQRFTVMMLMGIVFKDYWKEGWEKFIKTNNIKPRLHFKARPDDEEYLTSLISGRNNGIVENQKMKKGLKCIQEWIGKFTDDKKVFCQYVYNNLSFFISYLPNNYDGKALNKYFERMNTAGRNLENHEILKIRCLQKLNSDKGNATKIWNVVSQMGTDVCNINGDQDNDNQLKGLLSLLTTINNNEKTLEDIPVKPSYSETEDQKKIIEIIKGTTPPKELELSNSNSNKIFTFSEFLLLVLYIIVSNNNTGNDKTPISDFNDSNKLLATFEEYANEENTKNWNWENFFKSLVKYRLLLDYFVIIKPDKNPDYIECGEDGKDKNKLIKYQTMLYSDGENPIWWTAEYLKTIADKITTDCIPTCADLLDILKEIDRIKHKDVPKLEQLTYRSHNLPYWLRLLDYYLWEENEEKGENEKDKLIAEFKFRRGGMSQEHLHPQNQGNETELTEWNKYIDSFGNMFLISQSFNSSQNNDSVIAKFDTLKKQIENQAKIESIKLYKAYQMYTEKKDWNTDIAKEHADDMYKKLQQYTQYKEKI